MKWPDNRAMQVSFTKMQGAGNDFVVLDETRQQLGLSTAQYRWLADRHFGVGADQILTVRPGPAPGRGSRTTSAEAWMFRSTRPSMRWTGARPPARDTATGSSG